MTKSFQLFVQNAPSYMFDWVLSTCLWIMQIIHKINFQLFDIVNLHLTSKYAYVA